VFGVSIQYLLFCGIQIENCFLQNCLGMELDWNGIGLGLELDWIGTWIGLELDWKPSSLRIGTHPPYGVGTHHPYGLEPHNPYGLKPHHPYG